MLKSSTNIGSKDMRPAMHINDRVLLGRMYIFMVVSCRSCISTRSASIKAQIRKVY